MLLATLALGLFGCGAKEVDGAGAEKSYAEQEAKAKALAEKQGGGIAKDPSEQ